MLGRLPDDSEFRSVASLDFFCCKLCSKGYTTMKDRDVHVSIAHPETVSTSQEVFDFDEPSEERKEANGETTKTAIRYNWQYFGDASHDDEETNRDENEDEDDDNEEDDLPEDGNIRSRRKRALDDRTIGQFLHNCLQMPLPCCAERCLAKFDPVKIRACRHDLWDREGAHWGQYILDSLRAADRRGDGEEKITHLSCQSHKVCTKAWYLLHGVSKSSFYMYLSKYMSGHRWVIHGATGMLRKSPSYWMAHAWLRQFAQTYGDKMPDKELVHLPSSMTRDQVFEKYKGRMVAVSQTPIAKSTFLTMWRDEWPGLKIPKTNRFGKCDVCKDLQIAYAVASTVDARDRVKKDLELHWEQQKRERLVYWAKAYASIEEPAKKLSLIIDGMDQNKTIVPHFAQKTKDTQGCQRWGIKTHVTGVLVHGLGLTYAYIDNLRWPHDSNLTCNVLLKTLRKVAKKYGNRLPGTMFLQMDNCWRECKNKFVFAFLGYLVLKGVFKEVEVGYLLVGHTHEDVDQFFSKISTTLRRQDAATVDELAVAINQSYPVTQTEELDALLDVTGFLGDVRNDMEQHTCPHAFRFTKGHDGKLVFEYKNFASDEKWLLPRNNQVSLIQRLPPPSHRPRLVEPKLERLELHEFQSGLSALWKTGKLTASQKTALDNYTAKQLSSGSVQAKNAVKIVQSLWPERELHDWASSRPTPTPTLTAEESQRINQLYKNYHKSWKTSEPRLIKKRRTSMD